MADIGEGPPAHVALAHHRRPLGRTTAEVSGIQGPDPLASRRLTAVGDQVDLEVPGRVQRLPQAAAESWLADLTQYQHR